MRRLVRETHASASMEFVLMVPLIFALLFPPLELGHFFWTQHKLAEAVRDGARYASRFDVTFLCNGATSILSSADETKIKRLTRTGEIDSGGVPKVPGWVDSQVTVTVSCRSFVSTGIYVTLGENAPIVTVTADNVTYPSLLKRLGLISRGFKMTAKSSAPVIGI